MTLSRALGDDTLCIGASAILSQCILNDQILPHTRVLVTTCCLHLRFLLMCGSNIMTSAVKCWKWQPKSELSDYVGMLPVCHLSSQHHSAQAACAYDLRSRPWGVDAFRSTRLGFWAFAIPRKRLWGYIVRLNMPEKTSQMWVWLPRCSKLAKNWTMQESLSYPHDNTHFLHPHTIFGGTPRGC